MKQDRDTYDVQTLAGRVAGAKSGAHNPRRHVKRYIILLLLTVGIGVVGFQFRSRSMPAIEDHTLRDKYPQLIGVYTTDPYARVQATTEITWESKPAKEVLLISLSGPGLKPSTGVVVTSSVPQRGTIEGHSYKLAIFRNRLDPNSIDYSAYAATYTVKQLSLLRQPLNPGTVVGYFDLPRVTQITRGTFFAHLPDLGYNESLSLPNPFLMSEEGTPVKPSVDDFILIPQEKRPNYSVVNKNPAAYISLPGSYGQVLYWEPSVLSTTEILYQVKNQIGGDQIESNSPVNGHLQDYNYIWTSTGSIDPILSATNLNSLAAEDRWNFYSGVVLGLAAAAGIAVFQELPRYIPLVPYRRRSLRQKRSHRR